MDLFILGTDAEERLVGWLLYCSKMGFPVHKQALLFTVKKLIEKLNLKAPFTDNKLGDTWFYSFLKRHPELSRKRTEYVTMREAQLPKKKSETDFLRLKRF